MTKIIAKSNHDLFFKVKSHLAACSLGLSATSQQYFSLRTNQPPATSQQYSFLRTNQHQPSATSQPNRLLVWKESFWKVKSFLLICPFSKKVTQIWAKLNDFSFLRAAYHAGHSKFAGTRTEGI
jgi:hypothetical protein